MAQRRGQFLALPTEVFALVVGFLLGDESRVSSSPPVSTSPPDNIQSPAEFLASRRRGCASLRAVFEGIYLHLLLVQKFGPRAGVCEETLRWALVEFLSVLSPVEMDMMGFSLIAWLIKQHTGLGGEPSVTTGTPALPNPRQSLVVAEDTGRCLRLGGGLHINHHRSLHCILDQRGKIRRGFNEAISWDRLSATPSWFGLMWSG